jgi:hypothetical protein
MGHIQTDWHRIVAAASRRKASGFSGGAASRRIGSMAAVIADDLPGHLEWPFLPELGNPQTGTVPPSKVDR